MVEGSKPFDGSACNSDDLNVAAMWEAGVRACEIARKLGCSRSNVYYLLNKAGVKLPPPTAARPDVSLDVVTALHRRGMASAEIARELKCSDLLVRKRLKEAGLAANGRTYRKPDAGEIGLLHSRGLTDSQIASKIGFSRSAIRKVRGQLGLRPNGLKEVGAKRLQNGYPLIYLGPGTHVYEHRIVAESKLGRPLFPGEVVHHLDGSRDNNSPGNLAVFASHGDHMAHHERLKRERLADCAKECLESGAVNV